MQTSLCRLTVQSINCLRNDVRHQSQGSIEGIWFSFHIQRGINRQKHRPPWPLPSYITKHILEQCPLLTVHALLLFLGLTTTADFRMCSASQMCSPVQSRTFLCLFISAQHSIGIQFTPSEIFFFQLETNYQILHSELWYF